MLDTTVRARLAPAFTAVARPLAAHGVAPLHVTVAGFAAGVGACIAAGFGSWGAALGLLLVNRGLDGLDGVLARLSGPTDLGGFLDFLADMAIYGGFVLAVAVAVPDARLACVALASAYYVNVGAWLSYSSLAGRRGVGVGDERSLRFVAGLAEGTETALAYVLICILPAHAATIAWVFAGVVLATAAQRLALAIRRL